MHKKLIKKRIVILLSICFVLSNTQYASAMSQTDFSVTNQETATQEKLTQVSSQETSSQEIEDDKGINSAEGIIELEYKQKVVLQPGEENVFSFTPEETAVYYLTEIEGTMEVSENNNTLQNGGAVKDGFLYQSYYLEQGKTYTIYLKSDIETTFTISKFYQLYMIDYDDYFNFIEAGGTIEYVQNENGFKSVSALSSTEIDVSEYKFIGDVFFSNGIYYYSINKYQTYLLDDTEYVAGSFDEYKKLWSSNINYTLEEIYNVNNNVFEDTMLAEDTIALGKIVLNNTEVKSIGYQESVELKKGELKAFSFIADQSNQYYLPANNSEYYVESIEGPVYRDDDINVDDAMYYEYNLEEGQSYTFYVKATEDMNFQITRINKVYFFDYDDYQAFNALGGTIDIIENGRGSFPKVQAPDTLEDDDFRYITKEIEEDDGIIYYGWTADFYKRINVLDGASITNAIAEFQESNGEMDGLLLKGLYQTDGTTSINPEKKATNSFLILAKYE